MYNKIKAISKRKSNPANSALKNKDGKALFEMDDILSRWEKYIKELCDDEHRDNDLNIKNSETELEGCEILASEIQSALQQMKNDKAIGNDNISKEMLQACGEIGIKKVCILANKIYESGIIPQKMKESIFITIPKKGDLLQCSNYRLISLMSHITKIILRVIM